MGKETLMGQDSHIPSVCVVRLSHFPDDPRLEREARALVEEGFAVDIVCIKRGKEKGRERVAGATVYRMPIHHCRTGKLRYALEYLLSLLLAFMLVSFLHLFKRYRVVQVNTLPDFLVFAASIPKLLGAKVLLDMQEVTPELYASKFRVSLDSPQVKLMTLVERLSTRFAHYVLCVSKPTWEALVRRGTPAHKVEVIMNVADDYLFYQRPPSKGGDGEDGGLRLMSHGTILERYGFQTAVEAVALLRGHIPGLHLSILGEGEYLPRLRELAAELGAEDSITFHGYIPLRDIPSYISGCHGGLVTNLKDCFTDLVLPTKLMEYVAMGKPAIASRTMAIEQYFDDSMVLFFEPGRADDLARRIFEFYCRPEGRAELVRNAQRFLQRYHWQAMKETYVGLVRDLANGTTSSWYVPSWRR
jgi:glycosyltransferase involved in cell wall biosynthesis